MWAQRAYAATKRSDREIWKFRVRNFWGIGYDLSSRVVSDNGMVQDGGIFVFLEIRRRSPAQIVNLFDKRTLT